MNIRHINPETLGRNPVFSQGVSLEGPAKLVFVGGQNGMTADGKPAGNDLASQSGQALRNVLEVLKAAGASQENVLKLTIYIVQGHDIGPAFDEAQKVWGMHPTAVSVLIVAGLAVPGALVEIEAVAAVEE